MDIQDIHEPIGVVAACSGGSIRPRQFRWGSRLYKVEAINGQWVDRSGDGYRLHYSVQVGQETYLIHFAGAEVQWWLDQVIVP